MYCSKCILLFSFCLFFFLQATVLCPRFPCHNGGACVRRPSRGSRNYFTPWYRSSAVASYCQCRPGFYGSYCTFRGTII